MWLLFMNFFSFSLLNTGSITSFLMVWTLISPSNVWRWGAALLLTLILAIWQQTHLSQPNQCIMQHFYAIRSSNKSFIKCSPWESRKGKLNDLHLAGLIKCGFTFVSPKKNLWHPDIGMLLGSKINPPWTSLQRQVLDFFCHNIIDNLKLQFWHYTGIKQYL